MDDERGDRTQTVVMTEVEREREESAIHRLSLYLKRT